MLGATVKWAGQMYFLTSASRVNIRQDGIVSLNLCNGYCYRFQEFQAAYHSLPKYIIQEDPLDGAVHIGRPVCLLSLVSVLL